MRVRNQSQALASAFLAAAALFASPAAGQPSPLPGVAGEPQAPDASPDLADFQRKSAELRERLESWRAKAAEYLQAAEDAESRTKVIEREIAQLQQRDAIQISAEASRAELDAQLVETEQDLAAARREAAELDTQSEQRADRRRRVPELLSMAKQRLRDSESAPAGGDDDAEGPDPLADLTALRRQVLQAEIEAYQAELSSYDVRGDLLTKEYDRATLRVAYYQALSSELREATQQLERREVQRETEATQELLDELTALPAGFQETLRELSKRNEALASVWTSEDGLYDQIRDVSQKLSRAEDKVAEVEAELSRLAARVEAVGLADSVGVLLRRHRAEAPDIGMYRRFIRMRQEQIGSVQLQQIKLREQREALADIDALVDGVMASVGEPPPAGERDEIEGLLRQLFETQRKYMDALIEDYETYFQKLVDFDAQQNELIARTKDLLDFIDERILWVPSGRAVKPELLTDGRDALEWFFGAKFWAQLGRGVRDAAQRSWPLNLAVLILTILFLPLGGRIRRRIVSLGGTARQPSCTSFAPTLEALGLSMAEALVLPGVLAYAAWRLGLSPVATLFTRSFASALLASAGFWATLRVCRQLCRPGGIAEAHCEWPDGAAASFSVNLRWLAAVTLPMVFVIFLFETRGEDLWRESIGRVAFLVAMLLVAVFNVLILRSGGSLHRIFGGRARVRPWLWRLAQTGALLVPIGLIVAALYGFYWTSLQFAIRLHLSVFLSLLVLFCVQLYARWSLVTERRAALRDTELGEDLDRTTPEMQVSRWMVGTGVLIAIVGVLAIWADLLPATRILDRVELWHVAQKVTVSQIDPSGTEQFVTEDRLVAITLADIARALFIGFLTLVFMRAVPGMLEATLFRGLGHGVRYAYSTIVKYAVVLGGLGLAFDAIGVGWSSIQWLVAAVGVGLGFGLQEIFANFVSGIIILLERPIRVGDVVTVGEVSGTVSRIRTRATWITAFDRKELLVPNKEFVTKQLINWTLSDAVLRLSVPVGIAYGSDTDKAIEVLEKVAKESWRVLRDPRPQVLFLGFGDSSLSFELRVFVRNAEQLFIARHDLHMSIDKAFREAGIEIAFPQRDLHVRTLPAELKAAVNPET